jgi:hypothetical protein
MGHGTKLDILTGISNAIGNEAPQHWCEAEKNKQTSMPSMSSRLTALCKSCIRYVRCFKPNCVPSRDFVVPDPKKVYFSRTTQHLLQGVRVYSPFQLTAASCPMTAAATVQWLARHPVIPGERRRTPRSLQSTSPRIKPPQVIRISWRGEAYAERGAVAVERAQRPWCESTSVRDHGTAATLETREWAISRAPVCHRSKGPPPQ